jgi:hypothetical protein
MRHFLLALVRLASAFSLTSALLFVCACGTNPKNVDFGSGGSGESDASTFDGDDGARETSGDDAGRGVFGGTDGGTRAPTCGNGTGWSCAVNASCGGSPTTLTGKVYDPGGTNPLYNVVVFIPNDATKLPAITPGTRTCNSCDVSIGDYVTATTTDATGAFTLTNVPTGKGVPVVVQIGKWRRVVAVDTKNCAATSIAKGTLRLPRNQAEGSLPQMALLTGGTDNLGCFPVALGLDPKEYSSPHGGGRLDIYQGLDSPLGITIGNGPGLSSGAAGDCTTASCPLWSTKPDLEYYDIVLLACEGSEDTQTKPASAMRAMHDWLDEGGKVFATHFQYTWFKNNPNADLQGTATWLGTSNAFGAGNYAVDTSFPKGKTFNDWLANVGALTNGTIALNAVAASVSSVSAPTSRWIYDNGTAPPNTKYLSFGTPVGGLAPSADAGEVGKQYCGKAVFSDLHAGGAPAGDIPMACAGGTLDPQLDALEFLFFDLSACVQDDSQPVQHLPPPK